MQSALVFAGPSTGACHALRSKFEGCAGLVVGADDAGRAAAAMIARLEKVASVRELTGLLEPARHVEVSAFVHA